MDITAPAKVNLYLRVLGKMNDGYHRVETLFERVSVLDRLSVDVSAAETVLRCDDPGVPVDKDSLMMRTVSLFRETTGYRGHFSIDLEKNIPVGAGMGGGSSDAAALLKGMNELAATGLDVDQLADIGKKLGADVPFFIYNTSFAVGSGRGDEIRTLDIPLEMAHIIINPPLRVLTSDVYARVSCFVLTKKEAVDRMFTAFLRDGDIEGIGKNLHNDLQHIVLQDFPFLEQVFSELREAGAEGVLLSGSGPTVFGLFKKGDIEGKADELRRVFTKEEGWRVFQAGTC
ncbi:MAG: 4-(cytidine 5'-diphospho)-2-C-methyl-D-erythritol kinase [Candidatus Omnitrophica bacterium]|nr:4-(cytidine 5'-diphospho)-2-C-methyl-D-erythritol kinase [Candidatus Omnitrophota bacterium]